MVFVGYHILCTILLTRLCPQCSASVNAKKAECFVVTHFVSRGPFATKESKMKSKTESVGTTSIRHRGLES